jgi:hypothetical protein
MRDEETSIVSVVLPDYAPDGTSSDTEWSGVAMDPPLGPTTTDVTGCGSPRESVPQAVIEKSVASDPVRIHLFLLIPSHMTHSIAER